MPKISVVVPSYNHGRFVSRAIRSALEQSFSDIEVIVVDDGSQDNSLDEIRAIDDPRLRLISFPENQGAAEATNRGILEASGEFVAILNSDDSWRTDKLERQLSVFEAGRNLGAVFTWANFVDENGRFIDPDNLPFGRVFEESNRSRGLWLRRFLLQSNCLCHPSVLIRREVYDRVGLYDERFRQLPDMDMWIRVCSLHNIHIVPEPLVNFRLLQSEKNTSAISKPNLSRMVAENMLLAEKLFDLIDMDTFVEGFGDICIVDKITSDAHRKIEEAFLLVGNPSDLGRAYKPVGIKRLFDLLGDPETRTVLKEDYGFGTRQFHELLGKNQIPVIETHDLPSGVKSL